MRLADVQLSGYEEPLPVFMLGSINGENHDYELRIHAATQLDEFWLVHERQTDVCVVVRVRFRLPRCHVGSERGGCVCFKHPGNELLGSHWARCMVQPFVVASNFAKSEQVKVLLMNSFVYHAR